jgi:hypothetical protein
MRAVSGTIMRKVLGIALLVSVLGNIVLLYRVLDMGVTTTYGADEISRRGKQVADVQKLLPLLMPHTSRADLLGAAQKAGLEIIDKGQEGMYVGDVQFIFSGDQVTAVKFD